VSKNYCIDSKGLQRLYERLKDEGTLIAPTIKDGVIAYEPSERFEDLPQGWIEVQGPGHYRLKKSGTKSIFSYRVAPSSWKRFLYPPKELIFTAQKNEEGFQVETPAPDTESRVFFGVRPCELRAIRAQEKVFAQSDFLPYQTRLDHSLILAVACVTPGENCFCADVNSGPGIEDACDFSLIEWGVEPRYLLCVGSYRATKIIEELKFPLASPEDVDGAAAAVNQAKKMMGRSFDRARSADLLTRQYAHPAFAEVSERCTACGNCTLVCPTCFCSNLEDHTSLDGKTAQRYRTWDSCFTLDFTYIHGGHARGKPAERYRQWLTHKLSNWEAQFDEPGCVGCGRCITWCPEGLDLTEEFKRLLEIQKESAIRYRELT